MKILMLGWELPPHNSGGLGVACYYMAKALAHSGVDIDFVVPYDAPHPEIDFMRVHAATHLTPRPDSHTAAYSTSVAQRYLADVNLSDANDMRSVQKRYVHFVEDLLATGTQFDAIHAHDWLTIEAGMRAREVRNIPLIVHVHATEFDRSGTAQSGNTIIHEIEYQGLLMADRIIAVSNATKNLIVEKYSIPAEKIEVVHNAFDVDSMAPDYHYDRATYTYLEALREEGYTIVTTITRFTAQKGLTRLMAAAAKASQLYNRLAFLFVGDGEQRDELIQQAADLGIADAVFFTGFIRGHAWRDAYSVGDIFVMSSVSEPFGLTALEAAHHNNALILTNQSGVSEVLHNIYRYDFWDINALADRIVGVATSPALQTALKDNVATEYARLSWSDVAKQCSGIYATVRQGAAA